MSDKFIKQLLEPNQVEILNLCAYRKVVDLVALDQGDRTGANVSCPGVELGDVVIGVGTDADMGDDMIVRGAVTASGVVRISARYDGHLTDGINAPSTTCTIIVARLQKVR